jgi:hypothetical protein
MSVQQISNAEATASSEVGINGDFTPDVDSSLNTAALSEADASDIAESNTSPAQDTSPNQSDINLDGIDSNYSQETIPTDGTAKNGGNSEVEPGTSTTAAQTSESSNPVAVDTEIETAVKDITGQLGVIEEQYPGFITAVGGSETTQADDTMVGQEQKPANDTNSDSKESLLSLLDELSHILQQLIKQLGGGSNDNGAAATDTTQGDTTQAGGDDTTQGDTTQAGGDDTTQDDTTQAGGDDTIQAK